MTGQRYKELLGVSQDSACRAVFDEYSAYVYTIVYNRASGASREDIEECVSDIFADVFFSYDPLADESSDMRAFIGTVAKRQATDLYRRTSRRSEQTAYLDEEEMAMIPSEHDTEAENEQAELSRVLAERIKELGEPDSTIVIQRYYFDRSSGEIADFLSMSPPAVRMRLKRALKRLGKLLEGTGIAL
ncbi:RNA polymerase sigma-70 factor, ECF subfamily [Ruminococcus sp. YE71]|uniref:RNA polymerase sigma factor n=1 Tax=unclassified Ruminococcus TaxID=2608920 RepID=UPI00088A399F|nr:MULTISPECIES: sigma-70 family RNA polymerase sigma factor [unclassified Ruminococcus]SDA26728.1 RNA polymerase sigma-70 factor, ECF subfamily [Ruminococcus sp. YE78]SFW44444.1 RNA polymerase sigma-70 factor, ECF subfamily [Ruminococcus sp. YE71]